MNNTSREISGQRKLRLVSAAHRAIPNAHDTLIADAFRYPLLQSDLLLRRRALMGVARPMASARRSIGTNVRIARERGVALIRPVTDARYRSAVPTCEMITVYVRRNRNSSNCASQQCNW